LNPPEVSLRELIYNNYDATDPAKADVIFPEVARLQELATMSQTVGKNMIWVTRGEEPHRPAAFTVKRVDLDCIIHIYARAKTGSKTDVLDAGKHRQNMIDEVCQITIANGPNNEILDFTPHLRHFIDKDDFNLEIPICLTDIHVQCTFLR